jgi:hypothetical protein
MPRPLALTLQALGAVTSSGQSATFDLLNPTFAEDGLKRRLAELMIEVTAVAGTAPKLNVTVQTAPNTSSFQDVLAFQEFEAIGYQRLKFATLERYVRISYTIAGTLPSVTFKVSGDAHVIYADTEDFFRWGLPSAAVPNPTDPVDLVAASLLGASSTANAKIPRAYTLPLQDPYPESLRLHVSKLAAWSFLTQRGFDPDSPADKEVKLAGEEAEEWFDMLGGGVEPDWIDSTPDVYDAGAGVASGPRRYWGC